MPDTPPPGRLLVCATPIGNLDDASPHLREVLASVGAIACEDTRVARRLLSALGIPAPRLLSYRADNERECSRGLIALLQQGIDIALTSDAGTPAISDPGVTIVAAARDAGYEVVAVAGPSAVTAALSVAGIGHGAGHRFVGFLPRAAGDLAQLLRDTAHDVVVAFESPQRIGSSLRQIAELQGERQLSLARELTKRHERTVTGTAAQLAASIDDDDARGEVVLVLAALERPSSDLPPELVALTVDLVESGARMKSVTSAIATHLGVSSRDLYERAQAARDAADT